MKKILYNIILIMIIVVAGFFLYRYFLNSNTNKIISMFNSDQKAIEYEVLKEIVHHETTYVDKPFYVYLPGTIDTVYVADTGIFHSWSRTIYQSPNELIGGELKIGYNLTLNEFELIDSLAVVKEIVTTFVKPKNSFFKFGVGVKLIGKEESIFGLHTSVMFKRKFILEIGGTSTKQFSISGTYFH